MNKILELLQTATDTDLMLSRFDCHVKGLHSVVLKNTNGRLTRCFLADFNHEMHTNETPTDLMALGVHNHLYSLTLEGVTGSAVNHNYTREQVRGSVFFDAYGFHQGVLLPDELIALKYSHFDNLRAGRRISLKADSLHTVSVPRLERASWLVYEGLKEYDHTYMFTLNPKPVCNYTKAESPEQVRNFVRGFFPS